MPPLLLALLLGLDAGASSNQVADSHLARRQFRLAVQAYRQSLEAAPEDSSLKVGLARAWAGLGWCERAVGTLEAERTGPAWDYNAALDLGTCLVEVGRDSEGVEALEEALVLSGEGTGAEVRLAWEALGADDLPLFLSLTEDVVADDPTGRGALLLQGARAWIEGDLLAMSWYLEDLRAVQPKAPQADLVEAWAALEQGDPEHAVGVLRGGQRFSRVRLPEVASWLAEANRRAGQPEAALAILQRLALEREVPMARQALRLRVVVDLEGPAAAQAEIDALLALHPLQREVLATAWYCATVAGQQDRAAALAERHARVVQPGRWPLHTLVPLPQGAPSDEPLGEPEQP